MTRNDSDVPRAEPVTAATDRGHDESSSAAAADRGDDGHFVVSGRVTWADGSPAAGVIVRAVDQDLRSEQPLGPHAPEFKGETRSDAEGCYEISYRRAQFARAEIKAADLIVRALDANRVVVASSPTMFNAPAEATVDLTLSGAVAGQPSEYERLVAVLSPLLHDADPPGVTSLKSTDLDFLAGETGENQARLSDLLNAVGLYQDAAVALGASPGASPGAGAITSPDVLVPAFYGLLREGLPTGWTQLLQSGESVISNSLTSAVSDGIVPAAVGQDASLIAAEITSLAAQQVITATGTGPTPASALLGAASLSSAQQQTLVSAALGVTGTPQEFWASLPSQPGFDSATVEHLQLTLQLGLLTGSNVPLVQALLAQPSASSVKDLVSMDGTAWTQLLSTPVGGQPIPIPAGVPGATPAEQLQNYAQYLRTTVQSVFPNETVAHLVATGAISTGADVQGAIGQFFTNSPDFDIRTTRITSYIAANGSTALASIPAAVQPHVISELQRTQRAFQMSVDPDSMTRLLALGLDAAHLVADVPPQSFADRFAAALGGTGTAEAIHQRATYINARNLGLIIQLNDALHGATAPGLTGGAAANADGSSATQQILQQYPDYAELFGALDPCGCDQCTSVISPAAYLVDILQFLGGSTPNDFLPPGTSAPTGPSPLNAAGNTPLDVLIGGGKDQSGNPLPGRRPDLQYLKLTCQDTNTELPYIDLVNEVMESYILYNGPAPYAAHDTGDTTTTELDASPQYTIDDTQYTVGAAVEDGPYVTLANACYPFTLPFNEPIAVARTYLRWLGTSRYQVMQTFQTTSGLAAAAIDAEYLNLDPYLYQLLTGTTLTGQPAPPPSAAALYGNPPAGPYASWETNLASVPVFLQQTGIQTTDLIALLQTRFANPGYPLGPDRTFLSELPFGYATLMALVNADFNITAAAVLAADPTIAADLSAAGIDATAIQAWWQRNPDLAASLVIYCPDGCDMTDASISQLSGLGSPPPAPAGTAAPPSPAPPTDAEFETLQAFIRLWRVLGWSMADLDRAFTALGTAAVTSGAAVLIPAAFIQDLARIAQLQAALNPPALQVLFALWGDLDPNGQDSLYLQLFGNPAALPNDPAFAPLPDGAVLQDATQTITGHVPALLAGLRVSASDLTLIRADAGLADTALTPRPLTLANVSELYRYAALAQALGLSVSDFITLKTLTALDPFASPNATSTFVNVAQQLKLSNFTAPQLAYLYQDVSAPPTGLAPQPTTLQMLAQPLRDGLAQIAAQCAIGPDPKGTLAASTITQLVSKTAATQTVAMINGTAVYPAPLAALPPGIDLATTPAEVRAKLSYNPATSTLAYQGAMTSQEQAALLALSADAAWQAAIASLYAQSAAFLADNLAPLLGDPGAPALLLTGAASLDGNLNPVLVDAAGNAVADPPQAASTAIAWKFAYLLGKLLPYLQNTLSHTLVKQTIADAFTLDPTLTSLLLEQVLTAPGTPPPSPAPPVITDLLALGTPGVTATWYAAPDLSGPPSAPSATVAGTSFALQIPSGNQSASFTAWLEVPSSTSFTFSVTTNGTPRLFVGDPSTPLVLQADPTTAGRYVTATNVALTAGGFTYLGLQVTSLPAGPQGTVTLSWQSPGTQGAPATPAAPSPQGTSIPNAPIPGSVLLPDAVYQAYGSAYIRIQKAALLASEFALTAAEIQYLTGAGAATPQLFAGFDLNALPLTPGVAVPAGTATALFAVWLRLYAYTALRNGLPNGSVTLVDLFTSPTFGAAASLVPQVTGWPQETAAELLSAFFPALTPSDPNPFADEITLTAMQECANLAARVGAAPAQLFSWAQYSWANTPPTTPQEASYAGLHTIAGQIRNAAAANYNAEAWPSVAGQLNNTLRASRRDALVSYLMGQLGYTDPDSLFDLLLIDPEMGTCMQTSRIRQALNSVQLFVQRCLLGLEKNAANPAVSIDPSQIDATTWRTWMSAYATWAANREVFLWPENWLLPSLRDDQTEIFQTFASSLQQGTITDETVSTAFLAYLQGLEQIDRLDVRSVYWQGPDPNVPGSVGVLHVFARTWHDPQVYFHRQLVGNPGGTQTWTSWQQISVDIQGDFLMPVLWEGRLRLIWPVFTSQAYTPPPAPVTGTSSGGHLTGNPGSPPQTYWLISLAWSNFYQGAWQPKQVSADFLASLCWAAGVYEQPPQELHVFKARIDNNTDLVIDTYSPLLFPVRPTQPSGIPTQGVALLGEFRFSACGDTITVGYANRGISPPDIAASPDLSTSQPASSQLQYGALLLAEPNADPYNNGTRQESKAGTAQALQLLTGSFGSTPWPANQVFSPPTSTSVKYLSATPSRFELRYSQQDWQFALQEPFFYQDAQRTFFVTPRTGIRVRPPWLLDPNQIDARGTLISLTASTGKSSRAVSVLGTAPSLAAAWTRNALAAAPAAATEPVTTIAATALAGYTEASTVNWGGQFIWWPPVPTRTGLLFQTHRHPYVCQLIESLVAAQGQSQSSGGISGLLNLANQNLSNGFDFTSTYEPVLGNTLPPGPTETIDFSPTGPYSGYNWELFFHAPLLVALTLSQNGQYEDADTWFRYIFDPTNPATSATSPIPYWQVQPFTTSVPETLLQLMNDIDSGDPDAVAQVADWYRNPFQPFVIARSRIGAFQKYVFMAYLDNLIAWADQLYGQVDSIESINQASQLYMFASGLLGKLAEQIPAPQSPIEYDYQSIQGKLDAFSNFCEMLENEFPFAGPVPSDPQSQASGLLGLSKSLFFCIPQNQKLLQYWSTVEGRLYNIRHCLNIQGVPQQLALFQQPANPLLLIEAEAEGIDPGSVLAEVSAPLPNYRFSYLIQRAAELAGTCQAFGRQLLDALEKNDAEGLALLRATQETQILTLMTDMKQQQVNEAQANVAALSASRAVALTRYSYYQQLLAAGTPATPAVGASINLAAIPNEPPQSTGGVQLLSEEAAELSLSTQAALLHASAGLLQTLASNQAIAPTISAGTAFEPFGTGGNLSVSFGGSNLASSTEARVHGIETVANYLTYQSWSAGKMGGYFRRQQEWSLQNNLAAGEIMQVDQQTLAAQLRVKIAQDDLSTHTQQVANAQKVKDYLTSKFTSQQLYGWMIGQVSSLYSQLYQLAYSTAKLAEVAYQRELSVTGSNYITFGYWDSLRKGLLAGDRLQLAVKQLERAYIDQNQREFEITRYVSLLLHDPAALIALKTTGECVVDLPEALFDTDYPGQYLRRLRDVSLTIPCVAGPYTSINCTLTLVSSKIRFDPSTGNGSASYPEKPVNTDPRFIYNFGSTAAIATSHAQDDSGVFSVNFRDERYLPFETAGAVSTWLISMPPGCNAFDFDTITDVIFKLSYTARYGGDLLRSQAYAAAVLPSLAQQTAAPSLGAAPAQTAQDRLFSLKHEFPTEWYGLLHPSGASAEYGQMPVWTVTDRFPFQYRGRNIQVTGIGAFALLRSGATPPDSLSIYLVNAGLPAQRGTPPAPPSNPGTQVSLRPDTLYGTGTLYGVMPAPSSPVTVPQLWWLSIAQSDLGTVLDSIEDFYLLVQYKVG
jgi:hypothetical protein